VVVSRGDGATLIEAATTPFRDRDPSGRILPSPAFMDLPPEARDELAARQAAMREVERAMHRFGWSGTMQAVMSRIMGG
jgi:hypothetical protein